jgi:hypothetical protein
VDLPFELRGKPGRIVVELTRNEDPERWGCDHLLFGEPTNLALGYPVCSARVEVEANGYGAVFGWIQVVQSSDGATGGRSFEVDPIAVYRNVPTPFAWFGVKPTLFDAPFRFSREGLTWICHAYLCFLPDAVLSPRVRALTGFEWGFEVSAEDTRSFGPLPLLSSAWDENALVLREAYPQWEFDDGFHSS